MNYAIAIVFILALSAFIVWQVFSIVKTVRERKKKKEQDDKNRPKP